MSREIQKVGSDGYYLGVDWNNTTLGVKNKWWGLGALGGVVYYFFFRKKHRR